MFQILTFLSFWITFKFIIGNTMITLTQYPGVPVRQIYHTKTHSVLSFDNQQVYSYQSSTPINIIDNTEEYGKSTSSFYSLSLLEDKQQTLHVACNGLNSLQAYTSDSLPSIQYTFDTYDKTHKCSLKEGLNNMLYLSYANSISGRKVAQIEFKNNAYSFVKNIFSYDASIYNNTELLCDFFSGYLQQIVCFWRNYDNFTGIVLDVDTMISSQITIPIEIQIEPHYQMIEFSNGIALFAMNSNKLKGFLVRPKDLTLTNIPPDGIEVTKKKIIASFYSIRAFSLAKLNPNTLLVCLSLTSYLQIKQLEHTFLYEMNISTSIPIIDGSPYMIGNSIGVFPGDIFGVIASFDSGKNILLRFPLDIPTCSNHTYQITIGQTPDWTLLNTIDNYDMSLEVQIMEVVNAVPIEYSPLHKCDFYPMNDSSKKFLMGGSYTYDYILRQIDYFIINGVIQCQMTIQVCYPTCLTCLSFGTKKTPECTSCNETIASLDQQRCVPCNLSISYYYIDTNSDYQCVPQSKCSTDYPFLLHNTSECIKQCSPIYCTKLCPNTCTLSLIISILACNCYNSDQSYTEKIGLLENLDYIKELSFPSTLLSTGNSTYQFFLSSQSNPNQPLNVSSFFPGEIDKIKEKCGVPLTEDIMIKKIDTVVLNMFTNQVSMKYYFSNGTEIDLEKCKPMNINMNIPIANTSNEDYQHAKNLSALGIDVYNPSHAFFNDICFNFNTSNKTDIPRKDRIHNYLQNNSTICPTGYTFKGINFTSNTAECSIDPVHPAPKPDPTTFDTMKDKFANAIPEGNWKVVFCYNRIFKSSVILTNFGFWFCIALIIAAIINFAVFAFVRYKPLEDFLYKLIPPLNNTVAPSAVAIEKKPPHVESKTVVYHKQTIELSSIVISHTNLPINPHNIQEKLSDLSNTNTDPIHKYTIDDYDEMDFLESCEKDTRNIFQHYWASLRSNHPIIFSFFVHSPKVLRTVKIAMFILRLGMDFAFSAFFYSDQFISANYNGNGNFLTDMPISLYTYAMSTSINFIFDFLVGSERGINKIINVDPMEREVMIFNFLQWYEVRIILFNILQCIFHLGFCYYITAFCGVYSNSNEEWFISGMISTAIGQAVPFATSIVYASIFHLAIKFKMTFLNRFLILIQYLSC